MASRFLAPGTILGGYRILDVAGRGGMGVVYKAEDAKHQRLVALKVISQELAKDETLVARFRREGKAGAFISHENVTALYDVGEEGGTPYLVFEFVSGGTLEDKLKKGPLPWREATAAGAGIARGLAAIHEAGLVHRDLKPGNVLLQPRDGREVPKLSDFGLVGAVSISLVVSRSLTASDDVVGTLEFISPEQGAAEKHLTPRADLYSLGATLYMLLTGRPPFEGFGYALVKKHLNEAPLSLRERVPEIPEELDRLVLRLLEKDPEKRPEDALAVARELERIARRAAPGAGSRWTGPRAVAAISAVVVLAGLVVLAVLAPWDPGETAAPVETATPTPLMDEVARLVSNAASALERGSYERAIGEASRAIALGPGRSPVWFYRGAARARKGDQDGALADLDRAVELDPRDARAWAERASVKNAKGDLEGALADLDRSIELDPRRGDVLLLRAAAREKRGDVDGALADYGSAIEIGPRDARVLLERARLRQGKKDQDGALADLDLAIEQDPGLGPPRRMRAGILAQRGDLTGALADWTRVLDLDPKDAEAWFLRGELERRKGDLDAAIADATEALRLEPRLLSAQLLRGVSRQAKGQMDEAAADLEAFLERAPNDPQAPAARRALDRIRGR